MKQKIQSIKSLAGLIKLKKLQGKKIVQCHGVFDLLHIGHVKHFKEAKKLGDILVVTITSDSFVNKGPGRPAFNQEQRSEGISSLDCVDFVAINDSPTAIPAIKELKPNFYSKGPDYKFQKNDITNEIKNEIKEVKKYGGRIIITKTPQFSSSNLINSSLDLFTEKQKIILNKVKKNFSFNEIKNIIEKFNKIKILVIGETIIDQYFFCEALGKSGKEPVLVLRDLSMEQYLGGALAIARSISQFSNKITLLSAIGEKGELLKDIKKSLPKNIVFDYIKKKNSPTIIKKRFVESYSNNKILGVYKLNDDVLEKKDLQNFEKKLKKLISSHDLVIVSDYGHGLISEHSAKIISKYSKYFSLNAQINAANIGHHSAKKYKNIDCLIINEREIRYELRDKNSNISGLMKKLAESQNIKDLIVTSGTQGSKLYNKKYNKISTCDAFAKKAVDKIGAGDAMLSIISICLYCGLNKDLSLLIGSLAAAQLVETIGNKEAVNKVKLLKSLYHLLK